MLRRSSPKPPLPPPSKTLLFCYLRCCSAYLHPLASFHGGGTDHLQSSLPVMRITLLSSPSYIYF
ncbi:hypothetical protein I7I53_03656 [Histoplasma capsulatum var. duboisii H88]|uniref:Uncharacterized protein n=1 Tax=Ajellomyces capsulatus (strain H88) TaxID=544711 RepID=A0A8A1LRE9_AJEC8|nr:hypothetical protein I7I53_03656 [Histoplasma capsulatum var. duboisii H88]